jgi:hypothetical protein
MLRRSGRLSGDAEIRRRRRVIAVALRRVDSTSIAGSLAQLGF